MARIWKELKYALQVVAELVFPRHCAVCGINIINGLVCEVCRKHYLLQKEQRFTPREEYLAGACEAAPCDVLDSLLCLYKYDGVFKDALHRAKFERDASVLPLLREEAEMALPGAKMRWLGKFDLITCIPTAPERKVQRGYDIPHEIFEDILSSRDASAYSENVLVRSRSTAPLFEMGAEARRLELTGCFALAPHTDVRGKHVLLCDDIYTTGSTLAEAAQVLRNAGAAEVHALTLTAARENW